MRRLAIAIAASVLLAALAVLITQREFIDRRYFVYPRLERELAVMEARREPVPREDSLIDLRGVFHAHSWLSHDSMGTREQIVSGARKARIDFVFFTDHHSDPADRKAIEQGMSGEIGGVLFVPGVETSPGMLAWFLERTPLDGRAPLPQQVAAVAAGGGVAAVCHPDEPRPWNDLPPFPAMEIYNLHADAKKSKLSMGWRLGEGFWSMSRYPMRVYHTLFHDPAEYVAIWDRFTATRPVTAIAGNDAHQNNGVRLVVTEKGTLVLTDTGPKIRPLFELKDPLSKRWAAGHPPGATLWRWDSDLYERSFAFVNTHLLVREKSVAALREALEAGRAYVAFDSLVTASGFDLRYSDQEEKAGMGGQVNLGDGAAITVDVPLEAVVTLFRNGEKIAEQRTMRLRHAISQPGVYRAVVYLDVDGSLKPWIYSNPVYVR